jgi:predicted amidohydrolase
MLPEKSVSPMTFDLILRRGRVIDPSQTLDRITDVAFADGKVATILAAPMICVLVR